MNDDETLTPLASLDNIQMVSYMSPEQIVLELTSQLDDDSMVSLIKELDLRYACWDVSEKLYRYFKGQHKIYKKDVRDA